ncbi:hypothetical protein BABINDRAFT_160995 [Babjeviella inositovora NRRL Y-12698]|uniref:Uncharacterized protein n=1 Tax=Babjeviella inositovora NRRL Y-12698 TaxID=984486 RepID=A0A1E3QUS6_9ASCO|nr:uncharacterized protein BABINDRAFT_160995 [Babjeviella inositovora NRRL Y-12698]ODQ80782.1 hypothetical protein BABINDRAFT_160995 [Babjeviella inositovora NRRL Y-12698]
MSVYLPNARIPPTRAVLAISPKATGLGELRGQYSPSASLACAPAAKRMYRIWS